MEIRFSPEEEAFRAEAREWLATNMPHTVRPESADLRARRDWDMAWQRRMYDAGWAGISWPREFGGRGATLMEQLIWYEEYARAGAPDVNTGFVGLKHAGPTLIACGTEEQKRYHLPRILRGDVVWCQGFSEPNAGSDLAALQTRAEIDGDHLVVTGQKIWTSFGHIAEFQELLVRTDPAAARHAGITWVICPMDAPGIEIRPIKTLAGNSDFCEVFYDQVRIPLANVVGKLNDGWRVAMATLSFERGTAFMSEQVRLARRMEELVALAQRTAHGGRRAIDDDEIARRLALATAEVEAMRAMTYRSLSLAARTGHARTGGVDDPALLLGAGAAHRRPRDGDPRIVGGRRVRRRRRAPRRMGGAVPHGPVADHRRRHEGDPAQHHRRARARSAAVRGARWT